MPATGGRIKTQGTRQGQRITVQAHIVGADLTADELKQATRSFNAAIRDVMVRVGTQKVLPDMKADMRAKIGGRWADSLGIQRERSGVFIKSSMRGPMNRALGWLDFGGKRPNDNARRTGPYVIVNVLDGKRELIDQSILEELMDTFDPLHHTP